MTLALGARCVDGVAIVEDKKIYKEFSMTGEGSHIVKSFVEYFETLSSLTLEMQVCMTSSSDMWLAM